MNTQRVSLAAERQDLAAAFVAGVEIGRAIKRQNRSENLPRERILRPNFRKDGAENLAVGGNGKANATRKLLGGEADGFGPELALFGEDEPAELFLIGRLKKKGSLRRKRRQPGIGNRLVQHDGLFRHARRSVVEGFGGYRHKGGLFHVLDRAVDVDRHVSSADREGRLAAGVGGPHHSRAAGRQHNRYIRVAHEFAG